MSEPVGGALAPASRICLVGATGLVGGSLIRAASERKVPRLIAVARREVLLPPAARLEVLVAPTENWPAAIATARADTLVCALGTTMARAGSQAAFRAVDYDLVLAAGEAACAAGIARMIAVSSIGADTASRNFYLRTKGEAETALGGLGFTRLDLLRPGLIRGTRGEARPLETAAQIGAPLVDLALHGQARRFRSIRASELAVAILALASETEAGRFVHEYDALRRIVRRGTS